MLLISIAQCIFLTDDTPNCEGNRLLRVPFLISVLHTVWICYHNGADQCTQPLALPAVASMKKNFRSWVPTDRPWALYPLKANSHCMFKYLAQPLPSHSPRGFECPLLLCFSISLSVSLLSFSPSFSHTAVNMNGRLRSDGWLGCRCRLGGGWERRGSCHCWAGQHPLSSGAPSDGGPTDNRAS